jgi:DNA-binding MarR family transcriptional regulator
MKEAWDLRQESYTNAEIARLLKIQPKRVSAMLAKLEKRVLGELARQVTDVKVRHTAQLERVFREAFRAWRRSKKDSETMRTRTKTVPGEAEDEVKETITEHTSKNQSGTPSLLAEARAAMAEIRKLWGIDSKSSAPCEEELVPSELAELKIKAELERSEKDEDISK